MNALPPAAAPPPWAVLLNPANEAELLKEDRRSRVWRVDDAGVTSGGGGGGWVVKRYTDPPARQLLVSLIGQHPAQRERRGVRRLAAVGVPVAPIASAHTVRTGAGIHRMIVTPWLGASLHQWLAGRDPRADADARHRITRQLGAITGRLLAHQLFHRDHKLSNAVVDAAGVCRLIDIEGVRRVGRGALAVAARRMLGALLVNARQAAGHHPTPGAVTPSRSDRLRFLRAMIEAWPQGAGVLEPLVRNPTFA